MFDKKKKNGFLAFLRYESILFVTNYFEQGIIYSSRERKTITTNAEFSILYTYIHD